MIKPMSSVILKDLAALRDEAVAHLQTGVLEIYSLTPNKLPEHLIESTKAHLQTCKQCWTQVEDTKSKADFFSSQKTMRGDCD